MGVIVTHEFVCDFCHKEIPAGDDVQVGQLTLRRAGGRGRGRTVALALHRLCADTLARAAQRVIAKR